MTDELAQLIADNRVRQQGTFNGNPLVMGCAGDAHRGARRVAYERLHAANQRLMAGCERVIAEYLPAHTVGMGSKGCVGSPLSRSASTATTCTKINHDLTDLARLYQQNNGSS